MDAGPAGTAVAFRLRPAPSNRAARPAPRPRPAPPRPGRVEVRDGAVAVHGDLDLVAVREVRDQLLAAARDGAAVDLGGVDYVSSAGVGLIVELAGAGAAVRGASDAVRRVLRLSGVADLVAP